jgi:excisionase family DNA binding protein
MNKILSDQPDKKLLRVDEVAEYFDVSRSTIYLWIDNGILCAEKYRGTIRIPRESVEHCRLASKLKPLE